MAVRGAAPQARRVRPAQGTPPPMWRERQCAQSPAPDPVARLQSTYGNQALLRIIDRAPAPAVQRQRCSCGGEAGPEGECTACAAGREAVQRSPNGAAGDPAAVPPIVREVLASPGQALDATTQSGMEMRLGQSLHGVRLHTGERAAESAEAISARAYTFGRHVVFGRGAFAPHAPFGQRLLAHELTHVLQQRGLTATPNLNEARLAGPDLAGAERQAERVEQAAVTAPGKAL